jgi:hypothetical protein
VNKHVFLESIGSIEAFAALFTTISTIAHVYQPMLIVDGACKKSLVADFAPKMDLFNE